MLIGQNIFGDVGFGGDDIENTASIEAATFFIVVVTHDPSEGIETEFVRVFALALDVNESIETTFTTVLANPLDPKEFILSPTAVWPGYAFDGANITIPIASLSGISVDEVNAITGDWRKLVQSFMNTVTGHINAIPTIDMPQTIRVFFLEDWNRKDARFGRHMKRSFLMEFTVENSPTNVFNSGE